MFDPNDLDPAARMRAQLFTLFPWLGAVLHRIIFVPVKGIGDEVSCDREFRFFYDPERARCLDIAEFLPDGFHEATHLWAGHHERMDALPGSHDLKNVATDMANNSITFAVCAANPKLMRPSGVVLPPQTLAPDGTHTPSAAEVEAFKRTRWVHPVLYARDKRDAQGNPVTRPDGTPVREPFPVGLAAEEYHALLLQQTPPQTPPQPQSGGQGQPQQGQQGQGQGDGQQPGQQPSQGGGQGQPGQPGKTGVGRGGCGSCGGGNDRHTGLAQAQHGELPSGPNAVEQEALRTQVAEAVIAHEAQHGRGSLPAGVRRIAEGILAPAKVPWRNALRAALRGAVTKAQGQVDYTYGRRSVLQGTMGNVVMPGLAGPTVDVAIVADTSGSMGADDLKRVGSETRGILREARVQRCWWVPTDSTAADPTRIRNVQTALDRLFGGGGTDMGSGLAAVARIRPRVAFTVVITDGDTGWPTAFDPAWGKVLVVLTRECRHPVPAWATVLHAY